MDGLIIISILVLGGFVMAAVRNKDEGTGKMSDQPVSIDNIRRGVQNGWYTADLIRVAGKPAIRLSGYTARDDQYIDVYPISEEDWQTLKAEGYSVDV